MTFLLRINTWFLFAQFLLSAGLVLAASDGKLRIELVDEQTRETLPARIELLTTRGRPVRSRGLGVGQLGDHFYLSGTPELGLKRGDYLFRLDAGPEFRTQNGNFTIQRNADDSKTVEFKRFTDLAKEGWYAGDFDSQRTAKDLPLMSQVEALHFVPSIAWTHNGENWEQASRNIILKIDSKDRELGAYAARVELPGGALLLVSKTLLEVEPLKIDHGWSTARIMREANLTDLKVVAASTAAWELPVWISTGELDLVSVLTRHDHGEYRIGRDKTLRPHDTTFYPGKQGLTRWQMDIYFHLLNCGLKVTPVAGSGSGANDEPLGTNRTYVHHARGFSQPAWWDGISRGATVITNGPLLRPQVGGDPPGAEFYISEGTKEDFQIALNLATRDSRVDYLEILKNGEVLEEVRLAEWAAKGGRLPGVPFARSGWFAVRAVTTEEEKYQYALTAPYYVTSDDGPRISRRSVEFFLDWLGELESLGVEQRSVSEVEISAAKEYWQALLQQANAP